jgi:hypothetical protein
VQETWVKLSITVERTDGGVVDAELIRPRSWVESNNICDGQLLPLNIAELQVAGFAHVTSIEPCPIIAVGEGSVITGRFVTRKVDEIARVEILGANGSIDVLEGTTIHPIWSLDRNDWAPLGELEPNERLSGQAGSATVLSLTILDHPTPVYNIEVHGEHVYQVGELALLVHNTCSDELISLARGEVAAGFMTRGGKLITSSKTVAHEALALTVQNLTHMAKNGQAIAFTVGRKLDDTLEVFGSGAFPVAGGLTEAMKSMIRSLVR